MKGKGNFPLSLFKRKTLKSPQFSLLFSLMQGEPHHITLQINKIKHFRAVALEPYERRQIIKYSYRP